MPSDINEQIALAEMFSTFDAEIANLEERIVKFRHIKEATMEQLMTGAIRLPANLMGTIDSQDK